MRAQSTLRRRPCVGRVTGNICEYIGSKPVFIMSIRILHVHVHVHVQSTRIKRDSRKSRRVQIMTTTTTAAAAGRASSVPAACRQAVRQQGMRRWRQRRRRRWRQQFSLALNLILISPEWLRFCLSLCLLPVLSRSPALTTLSYCLLPVLLFLLSTNAQSKTQRPTVSPLLLLLVVVLAVFFYCCCCCCCRSRLV